jgi:hypothetical protein
MVLGLVHLHSARWEIPELNKYAGKIMKAILSLDWFKGKSTGTHFLFPRKYEGVLASAFP